MIDIFVQEELAINCYTLRFQQRPTPDTWKMIPEMGTACRLAKILTGHGSRPVVQVALPLHDIVHRLTYVHHKALRILSFRQAYLANGPLTCYSNHVKARFKLCCCRIC